MVAPVAPDPDVAGSPAAMKGPCVVLDSHIHFWDPVRLSYPWLRGSRLERAFGPADLGADADPVDGFVFVQADCDPGQALDEVEWVVQLARHGAPVRGVVAHAPLETGLAARAPLARLVEQPLVVGIRRVLQDEPAGFALAADFVAGVGLLAEHQLVFDVCVRDHQLAEIAELARRCPGIPMVLDHLGKPAIAAGGFDSWRRDVDVLAGLPSVSAKLSGLAVEADPTRPLAAQVLPYLRHALDVFGPDRCMFGSDWPVSSTAVGYGEWLAIVTEAAAHLPPAARGAVLAGTAVSVYGLAGGDSSGRLNPRTPLEPPDPVRRRACGPTRS